MPTKLLARPWARRESASTFLVTDFLAHIPKEVLAKNFGVPESAFANIPEEELYIFQSKVPGPLAADRGVGAGPPPFAFSHRLMAQEPIRTNAGSVRIVDSNNFPASKMIAAGLVEVEPGGMRELHWHPNADELQYYIEGEGRMTVYASNTNAQTFDYQGGDVGYVPKSLPHYIENTGAAKLRYLELWQSDHFADVSLAQWLAFTPYELVKAHSPAMPTFDGPFAFTYWAVSHWVSPYKPRIAGSWQGQ